MSCSTTSKLIASAAAWLMLSLAVVCSPAAAELMITPEVQLSLGDAFLGEGEYYRAVTEYKKFIHLFPGSNLEPYVLFNLGRAYLEGEEYEQAALTYRQLRERGPDRIFGPKSLYLEGVCYWRQQDRDRAAATLEELIRTYDEQPVVGDGLKFRSYLALEGGEAAEAGKWLQTLEERYPAALAEDDIAEIDRLLDQYRQPGKSPFLAGLLSAVLPGSGYFYAVRYGDGLSSFVVNALLIAGLVEALDEENYPMAVLAGGFGLPFYVGNIYGSANAARKWNLTLRRELSDRVYLTLGLDF